jgi:protein CMS1
MAATEEHTKKRKVQDDDKPRKKQKKQKKVREDEGDLDVEAGLNRAFERMDGQLAADYIAQKTRRFGTDLSPVELSDLYISGECLLWVLVVVGGGWGLTVGRAMG